MVDNVDRAEWAEATLELFASLVMSGEVSEETTQDLICNVGHLCLVQILRIARTDVRALRAIAFWWVQILRIGPCGPLRAI